MELQIFNNAELGSVRSTMINGEPFFVGKDVAEILGYVNASKAIHTKVHTYWTQKGRLFIYDLLKADGILPLAEELDARVQEAEQKLKAAENAADDDMHQALAVMKKYADAEELTQAMVQELIEKVIVTDPEHVEIVWKFKDGVRIFIGI